MTLDNRQVWRAAMLLANNLCADSAQKMKDAGQSDRAEGAALCGSRIREWGEPTDEQIDLILREALPVLGCGEASPARSGRTSGFVVFAIFVLLSLLAGAAFRLDRPLVGAVLLVLLCLISVFFGDRIWLSVEALFSWVGTRSSRWRAARSARK